MLGRGGNKVRRFVRRGLPGDASGPRPSTLDDVSHPTIAPPRRRRVALGIGLAVVVLCVGVPMAVVSQWFIKGTLEAGTGSACPACAVDDYLGYGPLATLGGDDISFTRTLCRANRDRLHEQAIQFSKTYLAAARKWNVTPVLSHGAMDGDEPENARDGKASITVTVTHSHEVPGGTVISGRQVTWRFDAVDENGWRVCAVEQPDVCRDLIDCNGPAPAASASATPGKVWDTRVPYRCLPDKPYRDLEKDCPTPPPDWAQPGPYYCAPDQPLGIPATRQKECAARGWS